MSSFWKLYLHIVEALKIIGAACLVAMMLLTCADVVGRFLGYPIFGSVEIVGFMAITAVAAALPYTHQVRAHIGVEIVMRLLPEKIQAGFDLAGAAVGLGLFGLVTWRMFAYARTMERSGEVSMSLEFPEYLIIYGVAFCFLVFTLMFIADIVTSKSRLKGGR